MKSIPLFSLTLAGLTLAGCAHFGKVYQDPPAAEPSVAADPSKPNSPANTSEAIARNDVIAQMVKWRLSATEIQNDLDGGVTIVRTNESLVGTPTGAVEDHVIAATVKDKLQADPEIGPAPIEVKASKGEVTLKGTADNAAKIGRAIAVALDTPGVTKVSSDVKVNGPARK